jgi:hypothetical protein
MKRKPKKTIDEKTREWFKTHTKSLINPAAQKELWDKINQNFVDLVESDKPLDPDMRKRIAHDLRRYYQGPSFSPPTGRGRRFDGRQFFDASFLKQQLRGCGMTAAQAEQDVADLFGITVDTLRKRFQRSFRRSGKGSAGKNG